MSIEYLQTLYHYNYWANAKLLEQVEQLDEAEFVTHREGGRGSVRSIVLHILSAEWMWLTRWQGTSPTATLSEEDFPTLDAIRARWQIEEARMRTFLTTLTDENLPRIVQYTNTSGKQFAAPLWKQMVHLANHGTQHRSETALILTELGHSPGDLDFLIFVLENPSL